MGFTVDLMNIATKFTPPTITSELDHFATTTSGVAVTSTTASFTPENNCLLVMFVGAINSTNDISSGMSVSGGGLTWTRRRISSQSGLYSFTFEIWTAPVTTAASMTVTISHAATSGTDPARIAAQIFSVTTYRVEDPVGAGFIGQQATTGAGSGTLSADPSWFSVVIAGRYWLDASSADTAATPGTGWTELYDHSTGPGGYGCLQTQWRGKSTSTSVDWDDVAVNGSAALGNCFLGGIEIKPET